MRGRKFLCAVIFVFILAGDSHSADKTPDRRARNIYQLFTSVNPRLEQASAKRYAEIVLEAAEKFKQDPYIIAGIIVHESTVNNKAVSKGGDYGLMQVRWNVHEKAIKQRFPNVRRANDMFDARTNIFFGTEIFRDCMRKSDGDFRKGLMRYSAGNTKLRDKVTATVNGLRAKDRGTESRITKADETKRPDTPRAETPRADETKRRADDTQRRNSSPKRERHQSEADMIISTLLRQYKKEK